jgi:hypothetical protein
MTKFFAVSLTPGFSRVIYVLQLTTSGFNRFSGRTETAKAVRGLLVARTPG